MRSERTLVSRACSHQGRNIGAPSSRTLGKRLYLRQFYLSLLFVALFVVLNAGKFYAENDEARKVLESIGEDEGAREEVSD